MLLYATLPLTWHRFHRWCFPAQPVLMLGRSKELMWGLLAQAHKSGHKGHSLSLMGRSCWPWTDPLYPQCLCSCSICIIRYCKDPRLACRLKCLQAMICIQNRDHCNLPLIFLLFWGRWQPKESCIDQKCGHLWVQKGLFWLGLFACFLVLVS